MVWQRPSFLAREASAGRAPSQVLTRFTCFTSTKVQILISEELSAVPRSEGVAKYQYVVMSSTNRFEGAYRSQSLTLPVYEALSDYEALSY